MTTTIKTLTPVVCAILIWISQPARAAESLVGSVGAAAPNALWTMRALLTQDDNFESRGKDVSQRLMAYIWFTDLDNKAGLFTAFVEPKLRFLDDANYAQTRYRMADAVLRWVEQRPESAARLYYVIGPGRKAPAWLVGQGDLRRSDALVASLNEALRRWSDDDGKTWLSGDKRNQKAGLVRKVQLRPLRQGDNVEDWVEAFLNDAAEQTERLLRPF